MAIVSAALAKPPGPERDAFVQESCGGDESLAAEIAEALKASEEGEPTLTRTELVGTGEGVGSRIGPYKLLQELGEGGCGVVYMAEQQEPIRRRVALKIIKLGMDSRQVIARFEAERQALALMDHPNIAMVLDAGTTQLGRPYFVMELVRGIPITRYCDEARLSTTERLTLFVEVCNAIQHAHQKGIIHRDIKPSNVLVTLSDGKPVPKVIDFGIAKATEGKLTDKTLFTNIAQFIGTPAYMSPEQAGLSELDIDTRSDIYSLGVLLYALLVGSTPFDATTLASAGIDEARRRIRQEDPSTPSTRLRTVLGDELADLSRKRTMSSQELLRSIEGDLDWIVMKALEKERTRRYDTASGLAKDIDRFLSNEPVLARPPSNLYRLQKFARRNRGAFTAAVVMALAACAVVLVLTIGLAVSTWLLIREKEARQLAADARAQAALTEAEVIAFGNPELIERVARARASQGQLQDATELLQQGRLAEAEQLLDSMLDPKAAGGSFNIQVLEMRVDLMARQGRFQEAATGLGRLMELEPEDHWHWFILAPILLELGDETGYRNVRRAMLEQFQDAEDALAAERVTKAASLRPLEPAELEIVRTLEHVFAQVGSREYLADEFAQYQEAFQLGSALVEFRGDNFNRGARLAEAATGSSYAYFVPTANAILAMCRHHQGRTSEARAALDAGRQAANRLPQLTDPDMGPLWNDVLIADIMLKEAAATLGLPADTTPDQSAAPPNP